MKNSDIIKAWINFLLINIPTIVKAEIIILATPPIADIKSIMLYAFRI